MSALEDLLAKWDALSKGETDTTRQIREAIAQDRSSPRDLADLRESILRRLDDLNVDGWIAVPDRQTGEPMQERVPLDYIADAVLAVVGPHVEALEAQVERVRAHVKPWLLTDETDAALAPQPATTESPMTPCAGPHLGPFLADGRCVCQEPQPAATEEGRP